MAQASEVTVSDAEKRAAARIIWPGSTNFLPAQLDRVENALAAFLAKRVPDARKSESHAPYHRGEDDGHNACRDAVLKGPQG